MSGCVTKEGRAPTERIEYQTTRSAAAQPMSLDEAMRLIDARDAWTTHPPIHIPRHPAEKFLKGWTIVLDAGHGGTDGGDASTRPAAYKAGPGGVKEAHVNLRVAHLLRRLLADAGANVIMTREGDETISLRERAEVANNAVRADGSVGADLFISVHHNAVGNRETNFTSVWYHGSVDANEVELDVARYVAHALGREMRTDVARTAPLLSSHLMYDTGFGVLRACRVPGILLECSFYTNPAEEQRLRDAGYNLREAYGVYVGLCEYAYGGRPTQSTPEATVAGSQVHVTTSLDEGLPNWWGSDRPRIVASSIVVLVDGERIPFEYDPRTKRLTASFPLGLGTAQRERILDERRSAYRERATTRRAGAEAAAAPTTAGAERPPRPESPEVVFEVHHANLFKHHNWPQRYRITLQALTDGAAATVEPLPAVRDRYVRPATAPATTTAPSTTNGSPIRGN